MLSLISKQQLESLMRYLLDEDEFMSPFGIRSLSKVGQFHVSAVYFDKFQL